MAILIDTDTRILIQGLTGREGKRAAEEMLSYGTKIVAGVTPGKGGNEILGLPVYDSVKEATIKHKIDLSCLYVPPLMVYDAALEALEAGIKLIVIISENVPIRDTARLLEKAREKNARIVGPSSIGILSVDKCKIGSIGGPGSSDMFTPGKIGVISKSGGMCAETSLILTQNGHGQSTVIGIGGDQLIGTTPVDLLELFEKDPETSAVVLYGEIGGKYEEMVAATIKEGKFTKPLIAYISGMFAETIGRSLSFGHAGAIIEQGQGGAAGKKELLRKAGAIVVEYHHEIPEALDRI